MIMKALNTLFIKIYFKDESKINIKNFSINTFNTYQLIIFFEKSMTLRQYLFSSLNF